VSVDSGGARCAASGAPTASSADIGRTERGSPGARPRGGGAAVFLTSGIPPFVLRDDLAVRGEEVTAAHPEVHDGALTVDADGAVGRAE